MRQISLAALLLMTLSACVVVQEGPTQKQKASKINVQLGIGYYHQNNLELANEKLIKALDQDPESSEAHHAFAVLQNRFLNDEKAEFHFKQAVELDSSNSQALNNYGAFLCGRERYDESVVMFLKAVENPLYKTPEVAYTNAASCLRRSGKEPERVKEYFRKALANSNYRPALINLAEISLDEERNDLTDVYLKRYHMVGKPDARSLWLSIRNELAMDKPSKARELADTLKTEFPDSEEYQSWLELEQ
jgi:type IV pilus assembly protein PilF